MTHALASAPEPSSSSTTTACPPAHAAMSAVMPSMRLLLVSALWLSSNLATSRWPSPDASQSGDTPLGGGGMRQRRFIEE